VFFHPSVLRGNALCAQRTDKETLISAIPLQLYLGLTADMEIPLEGSHITPPRRLTIGVKWSTAVRLTAVLLDVTGRQLVVMAGRLVVEVG
jgi:hypothetical protein